MDGFFILLLIVVVVIAYKKGLFPETAKLLRGLFEYLPKLQTQSKTKAPDMQKWLESGKAQKESLANAQGFFAEFERRQSQSPPPAPNVGRSQNQQSQSQSAVRQTGSSVAGLGVGQNAKQSDDATKQNKEGALLLLQSGMSQREVARQTGIPRTTLQRMLRSNG